MRQLLGRMPPNNSTIEEMVRIRCVDLGSLHDPLQADLLTPRRSSVSQTLLLAHGIGGRRSDLTQLAISAALRGARVYNVDWMPSAPTLRPAAAGRARLERAIDVVGRRWSAPVTVVAYSDAALLAVAGGLAGTSGASRIVSLGGYYGWAERGVPLTVVNDRSVAFVGAPPDRHSAWWDEVNPYRALENPASPNIELVAGDLDVQRNDAQHFCEAMAGAGHPSDLWSIARCDHVGYLIPRHPPGRRTVDIILRQA